MLCIFFIKTELIRIQVIGHINNWIIYYINLPFNRNEINYDTCLNNN